MSARSAALALALFSAPAWPIAAQISPPAPDVDRAAAHFATGEQAYASGDFVRAADAFEAAYAADPQPSSLWNAARSWHRAGEKARAANLYPRYVRDTPGHAADRDEATRALLELGARLGRLELVAPGATELLVDERPITGTTWYVNAGTHLVEAKLAGALVKQEVSVEEGASKTVLLERRPDAAPPAASSSPPAAPAAPRTVPAPERAPGGVTPWALVPFAGVTALAGALTIASGVDTLVARSEYLDIPEDERTMLQYDDGKLKQDRTNVMIGVTGGLALVTVAVAVFAIDWGEGTLVGVAPNGVRAHVRF